MMNSNIGTYGESVGLLQSYLLEDVDIEMHATQKTSIGLARIILDTVRSLWGCRELCDYTIQAGDKKFHVHKVIMASVSEYFRVMLTGGLRESSEDFINLKGVTAEGLDPIIKLIYTDGDFELSPDNIVEVLNAASHLQIPLVIHLCTVFMEENIGVSNCIDVLNLTFLYSLLSSKPKLGQKAADCIQANWQDLKRDRHLQRLSFESLMYLASDSELQISEGELFRAIADWSETDNPGVERISELIDFVNFPVIQPEELDNIYEVVPFVQSNVWCCHLVTEARNYHMTPVNKRIINTSVSTKVRGKPCIVSFSGCMLDPDSDLPTPLLSSKNFAYVSKSEQWLKLEDSPLSFGQSAWAVYNNFLIVCGGSGSGSLTGDDCYVFDPRFSKWSPLAPMNCVRQSFSIVVCAGYLYAIGGTCNDTIERYSFENNEWELYARLDTMLWDHSACVVDNLIYISGGRKSFEEKSNRFRCFDPKTKSWEEKAAMLRPAARHTMISRPDMLHDDGSAAWYIYIFHDESDFGLVSRYNPDSDTWSMDSLETVPRRARIVEHQEELYFVNGYGNPVSLVGLTPDEEIDEDDMVSGVCVRLCGTIEAGRYQIVHRLDRYPETHIIDPVCCSLILPANILSKASPTTGAY